MQSVTGDELADYFAALLKVRRESISVTANVLDLGADSIMLMEARTWIESHYGQRIEIRRFFEDLTTIAAIAAFLSEAPPAARPAAMPAAAAVPVAALPAIRQLVPPDGSPADLRLMRAQLALVAEVIEAQNRVAKTLSGRAGAPAA